MEYACDFEMAKEIRREIEFEAYSIMWQISFDDFFEPSQSTSHTIADDKTAMNGLF